MAESDTQDPLKISFPSQIGKREARNLLRHLVFSMPGRCSLDLRTETGEHFGERFRDRDYCDREEVPVNTGDISMAGVIISDPSVIISAEFSFSKAYDERQRPVYDALKLAFGAYDWGEISSKERQLVTDIRASVQTYFR